MTITEISVKYSRSDSKKSGGDYEVRKKIIREILNCIFILIIISLFFLIINITMVDLIAASRLSLDMMRSLQSCKGCVRLVDLDNVLFKNKILSTQNTHVEV